MSMTAERKTAPRGAPAAPCKTSRLATSGDRWHQPFSVSRIANPGRDPKMPIENSIERAEAQDRHSVSNGCSNYHRLQPPSRVLTQQSLDNRIGQHLLPDANRTQRSHIETAKRGCNGLGVSEQQLPADRPAASRARVTLEERYAHFRDGDSTVEAIRLEELRERRAGTEQTVQSMKVEHDLREGRDGRRRERGSQAVQVMNPSDFGCRLDTMDTTS